MTLVSDLRELPSFDYTDPSLRGVAFHAAINAAREQSWLARGPYGYIVLDRDAGEQLLRSRDASFPGKALIELFAVADGPLREEMERNILHVNGDDHARLRSLLNPSLSPRAVERHRGAMRQLIAELFEPISARDSSVCFEAVRELTKPYPARAIAHVLGAPAADASRLERWSQTIQRQFDAESMMRRRGEIEAAVIELYSYLDELLAMRRSQRSDDLISTLLDAEADGERLSRVECVNLVLDVLIGGIDTTQSELAHALRLFAEHQDQWALLGERPQLAAAAVEEVLRFEPVTPFTARIVEQELTLRDVTFPVGTIVMVCAFTGNRDGVSGDDRDRSLARFDIEAERRRSRSLTFGAGVHYCVGANLARVELEEALAYLAQRMRKLELAAEPSYGTISGIYGLTELQLRFEPALS